MSRKLKLSFVAMVYIAGWLGTAGAMNADYRARFNDLAQSPREAAGNLTFALAWSAFPVVPWVIAAFDTDFYYSGWTLTRRPVPCTRDPSIWCK